MKSLTVFHYLYLKWMRLYYKAIVGPLGWNFSKIRSYWRWTFLRSVSEGLKWNLLPEFIWIFINFYVRIKECLYVLPKSFQFHMACELRLCFIQTCSIFCCFLCRGVFCLRHLIVFYVFCRTLSDDWEQHSL